MKPQALRRSLFAVSSLVLATALAALSGDADKGKWVFLDFNNNQDKPGQNEVKVAEQLAGGKSHLLVFRTTEEFENFLRGNPGTKLSTLVMSGHALGDEYFFNPRYSDRGAMNVEELSRIARQYPSMRTITGLYGMGCYTAVKSNAKRWALALPNVRFLAGFDGSAPAGAGPFSERFLSQVQQVRKTLPPKPTLPQLAAKLKTSPVFKTTTGAVGVVERDKQQMLYVSNISGSKTLDMRPADNRPCLAKLAEMKALIKPNETIDQVFTDYMMQLQRTETSKTERYEVPKELPVGPNSLLRKLYYKVQELSDCDDSFFRLPEAEGVLDCEDLAELKSFVRPRLILLIHAKEVAKGSMTCAAPFFKSYIQRVERCGRLDFNAVVGKALSAEESASLVQNLKNATNPKFDDQRGALLATLNSIHQIQRSMGDLATAKASELTNLSLLFKWVMNPMPHMIPDGLWLRDVGSEIDPVCRGVKHLNDVAPKLASQACESPTEGLPLSWSWSNLSSAFTHDLNGHTERGDDH